MMTVMATASPAKHTSEEKMKKRNKLAMEVHSPKYRTRVVKSAKTYTRKAKHKHSKPEVSQQTQQDTSGTESGQDDIWHLTTVMANSLR